MEYEKLLNEEQLKPVYCTEGPVLVLAGAGSGKTRVLTYRIANLIEKGVSPYNILAITFTNKAAREMQERIEQVTGCTGIQISTFHSFCAKILRQDISALGMYSRSFSIYDDDTSDKLVARIIKEYKLEEDAAKGLAKDVRGHISYAKNYGYDIESYAKLIAHYQKANIIIRVFTDYQRQLEQNNAVDFDDLLLLVVKLFSQHPEILAKYQDRYRYIHVDEFQDTNKIQYMLLRMLALKYNNVFVVGDDDQSIYGWRGADYTNIKKFHDQFLGCKVFKLEQNYRSTKNILDIANKVISNNTERMGKNLWTSAEGGVKVECKQTYDEKAEADYVLEQIMALIRYNNYEYKDFAILVRSSSITRSFEDKLTLYNIPYRLIGGRKFYERKEIKDFLAYLQFIANPADEESIMRVINVPKRGIGEGAISKLREASKDKGYTLFEGICNLSELNLPNSTEKRLMSFSAVVNAMIDKKDLPLDDYADYVNELVDFSSMYDIDEEEDKDRLENIDELIKSIKEFVKDNPTTTLDEYLQSVTLVSSDDKDENGQDNLLTVATVHGVKGLEFKCVFIVGLEEGLFPIVRADTSNSQYEEERRIMYVAVTRARERLYLSFAQSRYRFGQRVYNSPSRFLMETGLYKTRISEIEGEDLHSTQRPKFDYSKVSISYTPTFAKANTANVITKDLSKFKVGQKVEHTRFGVGEIIDIAGENADIKFEKLGVKKFNMRLAPIKPVE